MKTTLIKALRLAFPRFLVGAAGTWCLLGPIILMTASDSASQAQIIVLGGLLALCYGIVLVICLRAKWDALSELAAETRLAMCFMLVGLLLNELTGLFLAVKHKLVLVYAFVGFVLAELARPAKLTDTINDFLRSRTNRPDQTAIDNNRSAAPSPGEPPEERGRFAQQSAELSARLTESQPTLGDDEQRQRSLVSAQADNQRLREIVESLGSQLATSVSQAEQATARHQVLDAVNQTLERELAQLKHQLAVRDTTVETLQRAAQDMASRRSEVETLRLENLALHQQSTHQKRELRAGETQLRELAWQNSQTADRRQLLESEIAGLHRQIDGYRLQDRELASLRQQLTKLTEREDYYRRQQAQFEARVTGLERELAEAKADSQKLDETRRRLRDSQQIGRELADENCRLWQEVSQWRERFAASEDSRVAPTSADVTAILARADDGAEPNLDGQRLLPAVSRKPTPEELPAWDYELSTDRQRSRRASTVLAARDNYRRAKLRQVTSALRPWRSVALATSMAAIAGITALAIERKKPSPPQAAPLAIRSIAQESRPQAVAKPQRIATPPIRRGAESVRPKPRRGTFQTVLATQVYSGPSENSALVADINAGMTVNVVNAHQGWLEIRSKHGRPPGFIRQETAVMLAQN